MATNPFELKDTFEHKRNNIVKTFDVTKCEFVECTYDKMKSVKTYYPGRIYYAKDKKEFYIDLASSRIKLTTVTVNDSSNCATKDQVSALDKRLKALENKPATAAGVSEDFVVNKIEDILAGNEEGDGLINDYIDRRELEQAIHAAINAEICELHALISEYSNSISDLNEQVTNNFATLNQQVTTNTTELVAAKTKIEELFSLIGEGGEIDLSEFLENYLSKEEAARTYVTLENIGTTVTQLATAAAASAAADALEQAKRYTDEKAAGFDESLVAAETARAKAAEKANADAIDALSTLVNGNKNKIDANTANIATNASDIATAKTDIKDNTKAICLNTKAIQENAGEIRDAKSDIEDNAAAICLNTKAIEKLNGDENTDGSVANIVKEAVNAVVGGAPESFDTLKEIADWISSDTTGSAELVNRVGALEGTLGNATDGLVKDVADMKQDAEDLDDRLDTIEKANLKNRVEILEDAIAAIGGSDIDIEGTIKIDDTYATKEALEEAIANGTVKDGIYVVTEDDKKVAYVVKNNDIVVEKDSEWIVI